MFFFWHVFLAVYFDFEVREYQIIWFKFKILDVTPMIPVEIMSKHHLNSLAIRQPLFAQLSRWLPLPKTPFLRNYMGGAFCYVSREYSGRVKTIVRSWRIANNIKEEEAVDAEETCHKVKRVDVSRVVQRS